LPVYEYRCNACGRTFEKLQKFSDPSVRNCPFCAGHVSKIISPCTFHLKGSGWYATDYAGKSSSCSASSQNTGPSSNGDKAAKNNKEKTSKTED